MSNICPRSNPPSNRPNIPGDFHAQRSAHKTGRKRADGRPAKRQLCRVIPGVEVIPTPTSPEEDMFLGNKSDVYDRPVPNHAEECLQCILKIHRSAAANDDGCNEAECDEDDARDARGPGTEVLRMQREGVVIGDVVLKQALALSPIIVGIKVTYWNSAQRSENHEKFPKPARGLESHLQQPAYPRTLVCGVPSCACHSTGV